MQVDLNYNITRLKESATLKINQLAKKMRSEGKVVHHFGFGQSPFPVHPKMVASLQENAHQKDYLSTLGLPQLREEIVGFYKRNFDYNLEKDCIIIGPGSKELIFQALFILEGPVIIPAPTWVSYGPMLDLRGKNFSRVITQRENDYKMTPGELKKICDSLATPQKILIFTNPNNPTGTVYSEAEIEALAKVCKEEGVIVINDEIYSLIDFTGTKKKSMHHFYPEGTIITSGLSKSHAAGGWRLGFLAAPSHLQPLINGLCSMVSETFSAVSAPIQYAAVSAYQDDPEIINYIKKCSDIHAQAGQYIAQRLNDVKVWTPKPEGAFYVFSDFENYRSGLAKKGVATSKQLADVILNEAGVALLPGSDFYMPDQSLTTRIATVDYSGEEVYAKALECKQLDFNFIEKNCPNLKAGCDAIAKFVTSL